MFYPAVDVSVCVTDTLCMLIRRATEGSLHTDPISTKPESPDSPDSPGLTQESATRQQHLSSNPAHFTITSSSNLAHCELVSISSSSPIMAQRSCSSALVPSHGRDAPDVHHVQNELLSCGETAERDEVRSSQLLGLHHHSTYVPMQFICLLFLSVCFPSFSCLSLSHTSRFFFFFLPYLTVCIKSCDTGL